MKNGKTEKTAKRNAEKADRSGPYVRKISASEKKLTTSPPDDVIAFEQWAKFLLARQRRRTSGDWRKRDAKPAQRAVHSLKRDLYRYLLQLKRSRAIGKLKRFIQSRDGSRWSGHAETDAAWVIRLVESDPKLPLLDKSQRHRMRLEMDLAARHRINHEWLAVFLREAGDAAAIKRALESTDPLTWARKYARSNAKSDDNAAF